MKKDTNERLMTTKQQVGQMNHYWKDLDHMASDVVKKKNMDRRFGIKNIKLDRYGNIISFDKYKRGAHEDHNCNDIHPEQSHKEWEKEQKEGVEMGEGKFTPKMIDKLKKDYEKLRGKRLSLGKNIELEKIVRQLAKDKETLVQLVKADIPFISMNARLILNKDHGVPLNKYEGVEMEENSTETEDLGEALSPSQRRKMGIRMRILAKKPAFIMKRKRMMKRAANKETLLKRARKAAIKKVVKKFYPKLRGKKTSDLSYAERGKISDIVKKKAAIITRFAKRMVKDVRKKDVERRKNMNKQKDKK